MLTRAKDVIAAERTAVAIIRSLEARIKQAARAISIGVAAVALAACASTQSARSYSEPSLGDIQPGALRLFVDVAADKNNEMMLVSGSAFGDRRLQKEESSKILFKSEIEEARLVVSAAPDAVTGDKETRFVAEWANRFQQALIELSAQIHGQSRPAVSLSVAIARQGAAIDRIHLSPLRKTGIDIQFEIPATLALNKNSWPILSNLLAHEIYHALIYAKDADRMLILQQDSLPPLERSLGEAGATLFGQCVSLKATGSAIQNELININDRNDGVLTDAELNEALSGGLDDLPSREYIFIGKAIGNTLWASRIASRKLLSGDELAARSLLALCTPETIAEPMNLRPVLQEIATDGIEAQALK